jgi:hypothetical protein
MFVSFALVANHMAFWPPLWKLVNPASDRQKRKPRGKRITRSRKILSEEARGAWMAFPGRGILLEPEGLMASPSTDEITQLLRAWSTGDQGALEKLAPLIYAELHRAAHHFMVREQPGHTLQTTALVNEVYLRLLNVRDASWQDRAHFFAVSAQLMRRILTR